MLRLETASATTSHATHAIRSPSVTESIHVRFASSSARLTELNPDTMRTMRNAFCPATRHKRASIEDIHHLAPSISGSDDPQTRIQTRWNQLPIQRKKQYAGLAFSLPQAPDDLNRNLSKPDQQPAKPRRTPCAPHTPIRSQPAPPRASRHPGSRNALQARNTQIHFLQIAGPKRLATHHARPRHSHIAGLQPRLKSALAFIAEMPRARPRAPCEPSPQTPASGIENAHTGHSATGLPGTDRQTPTDIASRRFDSLLSSSSHAENHDSILLSFDVPNARLSGRIHSRRTSETNSSPASHVLLRAAHLFPYLSHLLFRPPRQARDILSKRDPLLHQVAYDEAGLTTAHLVIPSIHHLPKPASPSPPLPIPTSATKRPSPPHGNKTASSLMRKNVSPQSRPPLRLQSRPPLNNSAYFGLVAVATKAPVAAATKHSA